MKFTSRFATVRRIVRVMPHRLTIRQVLQSISRHVEASASGIQAKIIDLKDWIGKIPGGEARQPDVAQEHESAFCFRKQLEAVGNRGGVARWTLGDGSQRSASWPSLSPSSDTEPKPRANMSDDMSNNEMLDKSDLITEWTRR